MRKGIELHDNLATAFCFLNLSGYSKFQEYRFYEESKEYRKLLEFFTTTFNKIIPYKTHNAIEIIPQNWYKHERGEVDANTKRLAIRDLTKTWIEWEKETKTLLETDYKELEALNEVYAMLKIAEILKDVSEELQQAEEKFYNLETFGYDIVSIIEEQQAIYKKYKKKIRG